MLVFIYWYFINFIIRLTQHSDQKKESHKLMGTVKSRGLGFFAFFICLPAVHAESLREVVEYTINNNPTVRAEAAERSAFEKRIDQARAGYFPTLDINAGYGYEQSDNPSTRGRGKGSVSESREELGFTARQMLFDGFLTKNEVSRQTAATNAEAYGVYGEAEFRALDAVRAYINVLRRQELLDLARENLEIHRTTNDQVKLRTERGVGKMADLEQSVSRLARAETNEKAEFGNLQDARTEFLRVVGKLPEELEEPEKPDAAIPSDIDAAVEQALAEHPILKAAEADIEEAMAQMDAAESPFFPTLHAELSGRADSDLDGIPGDDDEFQAMLRLRYNLFSGGRDNARLKETAFLLNQAKEIRDDTYRQVIESMRRSWVAYETVSNQIDFFREHRDSAIKTHEAYQQQFNIGQRTLLDLLDSANEMFTAKSDYANAKYDQVFAMHRILASMGALNNYLGVILPEEATPLPKK